MLDEVTKMASSSSSSSRATDDDDWFGRTENCDQYPFSRLAELLEKCETDNSLKGVDKVNLLFDEYLAKLCDYQSIYPFLRLVLPDVDGRGYNMKVKVLTKMYAELLNLAANTDPYRELMNDKGPLDSACRIKLALETMKGCVVGCSTKTVGDVNALLSSLTGQLDDLTRRNIFREITLAYPPLEQKWIARLILRDLKIGVKISTLMPQLHQETMNEFTSHTDMPYISRWLGIKAWLKAQNKGDGNDDTNAGNGGGIKPLSPFQPMLAKRGTKRGLMLNSVMDMVRDKAFVCDEKMDGERMVFHKRGREMSFYTRNGNNYTNKYHVLLTTVAKICELLSIDDVILDGEVLAWDKRAEAYVPFGQNRNVGNKEMASAIRRTADEDDADAEGEREEDAAWKNHQELRYVLFDCMYLKTHDNTDGAAQGSGTSDNLPKVFSATIPETFRPRNKGASAMDILRMAHGSAVQDRRMTVAEAEQAGPLLKEGELTKLPLAIRRAALLYIMQTSKESLVNSGTLDPEEGNKISIVNHRDFAYDSTYHMPPKSEVSVGVNEYFTDICNNNGEGAVVKTWDSVYLCGEHFRNKGMWMKMKPDHDVGGGISDLDVAIIGAYYGDGDGKYKAKWASFLGAVRQNDPVTGPDGKEDGSGVKYIAFVKIGGGMTALEKDQIRRKLESRAQDITYERWRDEGPPPGFERYTLLDGLGGIGMPKSDWPHVMWPPFGDDDEHITMTVQCAEIWSTTSFPTSITCRFPRCTAVRCDKFMWQTISHTSVAAVQSKHVVQQSIRKMFEEDQGKGGTGRQVSRRSKRQVQSDFKVSFAEEATQTPGKGGFPKPSEQNAKLFADMTFHVDPSGSFSDGGVRPGSSPPTVEEAEPKDPPIPNDPTARTAASDLWCVMYSSKSAAVFGAVNTYLERLKKVETDHPHLKCGTNENLKHPVTGQRGTLGWISSNPPTIRTILAKEFNLPGQKPVIAFYEDEAFPWTLSKLKRQISARDVGSSAASSPTSGSSPKAATAAAVAGGSGGNKQSDSGETTVSEMASLIKAYGGALELTAKSDSTTIVVGPQRPFSVAMMNHIRNGDLDVVSWEWVLESIHRANNMKTKRGGPPRLKSFVLKHLVAPGKDSIPSLTSINTSEWGEKHEKGFIPKQGLDGESVGRLVAGAMGHGLRIVRRASGPQVSTSDKAHAGAVKADIEQLYGFGGRGCRDWREIAQGHLKVLPRLGDAACESARSLIKTLSQQGEGEDGGDMEVAKGTGTEDNAEEEAGTIAALASTVAPLWSQGVVVWSRNNPPPAEDAYHDLLVATMQSLGCTVPPSDQIDAKNFRWRNVNKDALGSVSHILVPPSLHASILSELECRIEAKCSRNGNKKRKTARPVIVSTGWAAECVREERLVSTDGFVVSSSA